MTSRHSISPARLLLPLAGYTAAMLFALQQVDRNAAAEGAYLALLACTVLLGVAAIAVGQALELAVGTALATALIWVLPAGPARGCALSLLLLMAIAGAAWRSLQRSKTRLPWPTVLGCSLALHLLFRAERLLQPDLGLPLLLDLIGLPLVAAAALSHLARDRPRLPVLAAAASGIVLGGGWSIATTLALLALASGDWARRRPEPMWLRWLPLAGVAAAGLSIQPALAPLLVLSGTALAAADRRRSQLGIAAAALALAALMPAARSWQEALGLLALPLLMLPAAPFAGRARAFDLLSAAMLCLAALRLLPAIDTAAAPLMLVALHLAPRSSAASLQGLWSGFLTGAAALAASYPWLRSEPMAAALGLVGAAPGWRAALVGAVVLALLTLGAELARRRGLSHAARPVYLGLGAIALALFLRIPDEASRPWPDLPLTLRPDRPRLEAELEPAAAVGQIVVDSFLTNAAGLPYATPVALVRLFAGDGSETAWQLRSGVDTGEWAARRPDVAALPGFTAPPAWISWIPSDGELFAQRYRATLTLAAPAAARRIIIERSPELPPATQVAIFHLEMRPAAARWRRALPSPPARGARTDSSVDR